MTAQNEQPHPRNGAELLTIGGYAKFRFLASQWPRAAETMWVKVTDLVGPVGDRTILGTLANDPMFVHSPPLAFGSIVLFPESECLASRRDAS